MSPRCLILDIDIQRSIGIVGQTFGAVADGKPVDGILHQLKIGAIHGEGPETVLHCRGNLVFVEVNDVSIHAIEQLGVAIFVSAEIFRLFTVMNKQAFESACRSIEIVISVGTGTQIIPPRRIGSAAELHLPLHDLRPDRLRTGEPLMGWFVELGDIQRLTNIDAAAA